MSDLAAIQKGLRRLSAAVVIALCASAPGAVRSQAAEPQPYDKASNGLFTGFAIVTDDPDWFKQFQQAQTPSLNGKDRFSPGESGALATMFSNPQARNGRVRVECRITARQPDGSSKTYPAGICFDGSERPENVFYPTLLDVRFAIGEDEPAGRAGFDIVMRDLVSGRIVKLKVTFLQGPAK